eukprot:7755311-Alexandrium_andersonii.AAC.1
MPPLERQRKRVQQPVEALLTVEHLAAQGAVEVASMLDRSLKRVSHVHDADARLRPAHVRQ